MRRGSIPATLLLAAAVLALSPTVSQAGMVTGTVSNTGVTNRDLTFEGSADWAIWGFANSGTSTSLTPDDRKNGGDGISALTDISNGTPLRGLGQFGFFAHSFDWTDGTPVVSITGALGGLQHFTSSTGPNPVGEGFSFQVPASPQHRRLRVYVATHVGTSTLTASLSDGSAPDFVQDQGNNVSANLPGVYELHYAADSSGQTLNVRFVLTQGTGAKDSNAQVHAVSLTLPSRIASTPSLSVFGLSLLGVTLGFAGLLLLRRKQVTAR